MNITVYGAGEIVPAMGVFDAVSSGSVQMGHSGAYYWKGKIPAAQFFAGVPFGLNAKEMNAWVNRGGGLEIWRELYKPFNIYPIPHIIMPIRNNNIGVPIFIPPLTSFHFLGVSPIWLNLSSTVSNFPASA